MLHSFRDLKVKNGNHAQDLFRWSDMKRYSLSLKKHSWEFNWCWSLKLVMLTRQRSGKLHTVPGLSDGLRDASIFTGCGLPNSLIMDPLKQTTSKNMSFCVFASNYRDPYLKTPNCWGSLPSLQSSSTCIHNVYNVLWDVIQGLQCSLGSWRFFLPPNLFDIRNRAWNPITLEYFQWPELF